MNETVRGRPAITNIILVPWTRMIHGEWSSQRKAGNARHDPGPIQSDLVKRVIICVGWNSHREASNTKHNCGLGEYVIEEKDIIPGGLNRRRGVITNRILAL